MSLRESLLLVLEKKYLVESHRLRFIKSVIRLILSENKVLYRNRSQKKGPLLISGHGILK